MELFAALPEQPEAKRLLEAALGAANAAGQAGDVPPGGPTASGGRGEGPAHAYLLHGPPGVGKRIAAFAFAAALLGDERRVEVRTHPDLYVLEPLGEMIRIDDVRALRHDLHMRPFEAERRVYVVLGAERLNEDAADALLKDLEEPPPYAVLVLVASELGPLPPTILSRCQLVPFRRLSENAVREWVAARARERPEEDVRALARAAGGRLDRARRLLDPASAERRDALVAAARTVYLDSDFEPAEAAAALLDAASARAQEAKEHEQEALEGLDLPEREAAQRVRRAGFGAERDELLAGLEGLEAWYRDLVVVGAGAERAVVHADRLEELRADVALELGDGPVRAAESVRETWRALEEFNLNASLALEALFVRLRRELRRPVRV
jgi:DNA polymerase-3 subunit delta'